MQRSASDSPISCSPLRNVCRVSFSRTFTSITPKETNQWPDTVGEGRYLLLGHAVSAKNMRSRATVSNAVLCVSWRVWNEDNELPSLFSNNTFFALWRSLFFCAGFLSHISSSLAYFCILTWFLVLNFKQLKNIGKFKAIKAFQRTAYLFQIYSESFSTVHLLIHTCSYKWTRC